MHRRDGYEKGERCHLRLKKKKHMHTWKSNFEESKRHYIDWWNGKGIVLSMWEHLLKEGDPHEPIAAPPPPRDLNQYWFDPQWRADYLHYRMSRYSYLADILPVANTQLGPGSLASILGSDLEGREDTIWIRQIPDFDGEIRFNEGNRWWRLHQELLTAVKERAGGRYLVGCPDLVEGLDVLASMKGADQLLTDLILNPEKTLEQLTQINRIYLEVFNRIYEIIQQEGEMGYCYFSLWAPAKVAKLQADLSIMISEEDFRTFCLPFLREQTEAIDYTLYHLDGVDAIRHLDAVLELTKLNAVQWTPGYGQPQGGDPQWYELYRRILNAGKSVMVNWVTMEELEPLLDQVGNQGLHINVDFRSEDQIVQALKIVERYR